MKEEENYNSFVMTEDLTLLNEALETKLYVQKKVAEYAIKERQQIIESKLEALMNLFGNSSQEYIGRDDIIECSLIRTLSLQ